MARGWESKAIEQQQEAARAGDRPPKRRLTESELRREHERRGLELSRERIRRELETASRPAHRSMLEAALAELERRLGAGERPA